MNSKLLFVTERLPYPLDSGGNVRSFHLLRGLAQRFQVSILATNSVAADPSHVDALRPYCEDVRIVAARSAGLIRDGLLFASSTLTGTPFVLSRHRHAALRWAVRQATASPDEKFDAIHFNHLDAAMHPPSPEARIVRVLDQHNVVTNQVRTTLRVQASGLRRWALSQDLNRIVEAERELCNRMDACLVCSEPDSKALSDMHVRKPIHVVPNGVDLEFFRSGDPTRRRPASMVFVGTMDYDPCEQGVWYFCNRVLPLIRRRIPEARLSVVGRNPSRRLRDLAVTQPEIELLGRVEDIRPHVWDASVFVVPILSGSGTRLKILEAMAMGAPVVTTTIGVEGIPAVHGRDALIADEPETFAEAVSTLIFDRERAAQIGLAGRRLVECRFGWEAVQRALLGVYETALGER